MMLMLVNLHGKNFSPTIVLLRVSFKNYLFKGTDDDAKSMIVNIYG